MELDDSNSVELNHIVTYEIGPLSAHSLVLLRPYYLERQGQQEPTIGPYLAFKLEQAKELHARLDRAIARIESIDDGNRH